MVPSVVQTGVVKGCRETAQKLKGRRLNVVSGRLEAKRLAPPLAE